ncbi:MAG: LLM class flavin-dependent oxidoreductase, partial [Candidatus Binatia bacterium]
GLRRVARLGDGWLASAYNTTPDQFKIGRVKLESNLKAVGKDPTRFPNALVTTFTYITDDKSKAERVLRETVGTLLNRPVEQLRERLLVGSPQDCAEKIAAYKSAGVERVFIWPTTDELNQLTVFQKKVVPLVGR